MFRRKNTPSTIPCTPIKGGTTQSTPSTPTGATMIKGTPKSSTTPTSIPPTPPPGYPILMPMARQIVMGEGDGLAERAANGSIIADRYRLEKTIGKGSYGKVKVAQDLKADRRVAIKFIAKSHIRKPAHITRIRREISYLTALYHTNIVRLWETMESRDEIILVMEYVPGADLFDRIVSHKDQRFGEAEARGLFQQIASAVEYCHENRIIHRDLKPENVMVNERNQTKLIDFGFANTYHPRGYLETNCGSPLYAAPEIVQGVRYVGPEVDVWSLGVILFAMVTGTLPFEDEQLKGLYAKICAGKYTIPPYLSAGARDLIRSMLEIDSRRRFRISSVVTHPWVRGFVSGSLHHQMPLFPRQVVPHPRDEIIRKMTDEFNLPGDYETVRIQVRTDPDDPATAIYHLLEAKEQRERQRTLSATSSSTSPASSIGSVEGASPKKPLTTATTQPIFMTPQAKPNHGIAQVRRGQVSPFITDDDPWINISTSEKIQPVIGGKPFPALRDDINPLLNAQQSHLPFSKANKPRAMANPTESVNAYSAAGRFMAQTVNSFVDNLSVLRKVKVASPHANGDIDPDAGYPYAPV